MVDEVLKSADVASVNLMFPGYTGDMEIKSLNGDHVLGPSMIRREPRAFVPAYLRKKAASVLRILDSTFINENKTVTRRFSSAQGGQL